MRMELESVRRAIGVADACELLNCAFAFPDAALAEGVASGAVASDVRSCLADAGVPEGDAAAAAAALAPWEGADGAGLLAAMRRTYSLLYLAPGGHTPIFPYESAFLHVQRGLSKAPALFRSRVTLDVERQMREAGVRAKDDRVEPCDSVFEEFEFLSYLHAHQAEALRCGDDGEAAVWGERAQRFVQEHAGAWMSAFMERTIELAPDSPYAGLAQAALALLRQLP